MTIEENPAQARARKLQWLRHVDRDTRVALTDYERICLELADELELAMAVIKQRAALPDGGTERAFLAGRVTP